MDSKKYNNIKLGVSIVSGVLTFILIMLFVSLGYSQLLVEFISSSMSNNYLILLTFTIVVSSVLSITFFPLNYYSSFYIEHKYELSNQSFIAWVLESLKGTLVGSIVGLPVLFAFYYILNQYASLWWLPFAILMFLFSVVLAKLVPIVILPLFYKITPIENVDLKGRILQLSKNVNMNVENIFQFNMSKDTKKANAAFTGLGKTKKILLGDTLLNEFTNDEIETVIAHELGHYKHKHIIKNLIVGTLSSFVTLFLLAKLYNISISWFGFQNINEIAALPILILWGMILGILQTPLTNILSRKYEYEADEYAVKSTGKASVFINTLDKLTEQNLGDREPHPFVEWFFHSHPSVKRRIAFIQSLGLIK
ncbi:MAG: M48 family metallopeptidase [Melioribacteraceae bacterium]